jgi:hypothetical protein
VYLLRELTKKHKDIWATVTDNDGQFLLAEAAGALPSWLEPEVADNRVGFQHDIYYSRVFSKENRYGYTKETSP